jgi:hypothetical protein
MSTPTIPVVDGKRELEEAVDRLIKKIRDPEAARRARERMDRMREELAQRIGTVEVAVELIREARDP